MAQTQIGAISVSLGMNSAEFSKGIARADKKLDKFGRRMGQLGKVVAAAFAGITAAAGAGFKKLANDADAMAKSAQQIGVPIEELTALAHAADLSGVSFERFKTGLGQFSRTLSDSLDGLSSVGVQAFEKFGIAIKDSQGEMRSTVDLLADVADRFQAMPDGALKTAAAMNLFGRAGRDMIPLLNQGASGIRAMTDEAERLGLVISGETGRAAEQFNDNLTRISGVLRGVANRIFEKVVPSVSHLSNLFVRAATQGGLFDSVVVGIAGAFNALTRALVFVIENFKTLVQLLQIFIAVKFITYLSNLALTMVMFARSVRTAGLAMAAFAAIKRISGKGLAFMVGLLALASGNLDTLTSQLERLGNKVASMFPADTFDGMKKMFEPISDQDLAKWDQTFDNLMLVEQSARGAAAASSQLAGVMSGAVATGATKAASSLKKVKDEADKIDPVTNQLQSTFGSWIDSALNGTFKLKDALADLSKQLIKMFANRALSSLFGGFGGGGFAIPGFANGTNFAPGGLSLVGERGPELVNLPRGSRVTPAAQTRNMMNGTQGVRVEIGVNDDRFNAYVDDRSGQVASSQIQAAAPAIVDAAKADVADSIGRGDFDRPLTRHGLRPQVRQVG